MVRGCALLVPVLSEDRDETDSGYGEGYTQDFEDGYSLSEKRHGQDEHNSRC